MMIRLRSIGIVAFAMTLASTWLCGGVFADDSGADKVIEYYRRKANIPPAAAVKVEDLEDSKLGAGKTGSLVIGGRKTAFTVSADGRYAIFGEVEDLTVDPFKAVMEKISLEGKPMKGPKDAKVTIVEYSDFQCPFCQRGYNTIEKQVLKEYGDKVRFAYKHFPLGFHKWAEPGAVAVECAGKQSEDAYWKVYTKLFEEQKQINPGNLKEKVAEALEGSDVDKAKFDDCVDNDKSVVDQVRAEMKEGQSIGITGTPAFVINGRLLSGAQPFPRFKAIIDDELAR